MSNEKKDNKKKDYDFGGIKQYDLEEIESEVLNESVYLDVFAGSDLRYKQNVRDYKGSLQKLMGLNTIAFDYKTEDFPSKNFPQSAQVGFVAQEVATAFPELVRKDEAGHLSVNYANFSAVLTQGIQELTKTVEEQNKRIAELEEMVKKLQK